MNDKKFKLRMLRDRLEIRALLTWIAVATAVWSFLEIAGEVLEGDTKTLDTELIRAFRVPGHLEDPIGPIWLRESMRDITALGGFTFLTFLTITAVFAFFLHRKWAHGLVLVVTVVLAQVSGEVLKIIYDRPRPEVVLHADFVYSQSFPSGHATMAATTFLTLAILVSTVEQRRAGKVFTFALAILLTIGVGVSRIYLAVHWPTDVLAGWILGGGWALAAGLTLAYISAAPRNGHLGNSR